MHTRSGLISCVVALAACASNPDPRSRPIKLVERDGHGGWVVVERTAGAAVAGELIAVEPDTMRVLVSTSLVAVPRGEIARAKLWAWDTEKNVPLVWGSLGSLSTLSHGFFLVFSLPAWVITTAVTSATESRASLLTYPDDAWADLVKWARFPQGLPAGIAAGALIDQDRSSP